MKIPIKRLTFIGAFLASIGASGQLQVDTVPDVQAMLISWFGGSAFGIVNVDTKGATDYYGTFSATNTNLGLESGIILANGDIDLALGPNTELEVGIFDDSGLPGDNDLESLVNFPTEDASVIEFDLVPASDTITFTYVFASEEYPEWVASSIYNDVMGLWIDGENVALLPDQSVVCVNNVNCFGANSAAYICNDPQNDELAPCDPIFDCPETIEETTIQYDGFTIPLTAQLITTPGEVHHIKLGLADVSDNGADSGVFFSVSWSTPINSVDELAGNVKLTPIPNPASNSFSLVGADETGMISLYSMTGQKVCQWQAKVGTEYSIPDEISPGVYIISYSSGNSLSNTRLIVE